MDKLELRARARATARASGLFDIAAEAPYDNRKAGKSEPRGRGAVRTRPVAPPLIDVIDETHARAACKPMGELECIVQATDSQGRVRALYVIVPDLSMKAHYQRFGFEIEAGCKVLLDAAALTPLAVLRMSMRNGGGAPPAAAHAAGFNPYFESHAT
jgi:hypothetical protein